MKLLEKLELLYPDSSRNTLREWIHQQRVLVDGKIVTDLQTSVGEAQKLTLTPRKKFADHGVQILYEDRDIIVVDKPAGLLTVATAYQKELCLHQILKRRYYKAQVFPVHRLDRETSGVLVFAYTPRARDELKKKFETHDLGREYEAVVHGTPSPPSGTWQSYLVEDQQFHVRSCAKGRLATTHYQTLMSKSGRSLLKIKLETGRKHQIRVHASESGHPIVGDQKYGSVLLPPADRLYLHARLLVFVHPISGKTLQFQSLFNLNI
ncbi:MAG: RluA family pseudouridine synthase [Anaplasmataceae bacterium]|nr:RluA family pseudouridine synthase [Anaplasmataceae bacterium]MBS3903126.1 RluA family pseudouridine synthase [Anaplasmataceae bacterium]